MPFSGVPEKSMPTRIVIEIHYINFQMKNSQMLTLK